MSKNRYRPGRTSSGFRPIGQGLQASRRELQEQAQINIDALRLAKEQHKEATNINISGLTDKHRFEQGVQKEKHILEQAARTRHYEALSIKADRDVDRLKGEADEAKKWADFEAKYGLFAPKSVAAYSQIAQGSISIAQTLHGDALIKQAMKEDKLTKPLKLKDDVRKKIEAKWGKDYQILIRKGEINLANFLYESGVQGSKNERYGRWAFDQIKSKASGEYESVKMFVNDLKWGITESNADEIYEFAAFRKLDQLGISSSSKYGQKIIQKYQTWGRLAAQNAANSEKARKTTVALNKTIAEDIIPLKGGEDTSDLNDKFNKAVLRTEAGVWQVENGFILGVDAGKGGSFEYLGSQLMAKYPERFRTEAEVREFFSKLYIPDHTTEDGFSKTETWGSKHPNRVDQIVKAWDASAKTKKLSGGQKQRGNYNKLKVDIDNKMLARTKALNGLAKGEEPEISNSDFKFSIIKTIEASDISDKDKTQLYRDNELFENSFNGKYDDKFVQIYTLLESGDPNDVKKATIIYSGLDQDGRDSIRPEFELFNNASQQSFKNRSGKTITGFKAEEAKTLQMFKTSQTEPGSGANTSTLDSSAFVAMADFDYAVLGLANDLITAPEVGKKENPYKNNKALAYIEARKILNKEYAEGHPSKKGTDEYNNSRWRRTSKVLGVGSDPANPTFAGKGWVYDNYTNNSLGGNAQLIKEFRDLSKDGTLKNLDAELKNADNVEIETDKLNNAIVHLGYSLEDLQKNNPEIVISPKSVGKLAKYLIGERERVALKTSGLNTEGSIFSDLNITEKDQISDIIGLRAFNNTVKLAELKAQNNPDGKPKTQTDYLNDALEDNGYDIRIPPDLTDQAVLQNGVIIKKSNQPGLFRWNGAKVQFILPMKPEVRRYLQGESIQEIFKTDNGVDFEEAPTGSDSAGTITISDVKKFLHNGGIKVLIRDGTPVNVLKTFGIIPPTTDASKLPTKGELQDFLSPKEYRQKLDAERKARRQKVRDLDTVPWYTLGGGV